MYVINPLTKQETEIAAQVLNLDGTGDKGWYLVSPGQAGYLAVRSSLSRPDLDKDERLDLPEDYALTLWAKNKPGEQAETTYLGLLQLDIMALPSIPRLLPGGLVTRDDQGSQQGPVDHNGTTDDARPTFTFKLYRDTPEAILRLEDSEPEPVIYING